MMLRRLAIALSISTALIAPVQAAPLVSALLPGLGAVGSALLGGALQIGAGFVVSSIIGSFQGSSAKEASSGPAASEVTYGERVSFQGVVGIAGVGGHLAHYNEYANATKAQLVFVLADGWCEGLEKVKVNGRQYDLIPKAVSGTEHKRYWVSGYDDLIDIRFHDGRPGQVADTELVAQNAGWDATYAYSGHCYVAVTLTSNRDKFGGRRPDFEWIVRGFRLYDRRKDSTAGGAGSHRFNDPTTWEYTANPFVAADHFARGYFFNGVRVLGGQMPIAQLDASSIVAAMNVADQTVIRPDATTRKRYEAHFAFADTLAPIDLLIRLCAAGGGFVANLGGQLGFFAGTVQGVVATITDEDVVGDEDIIFSPKQGGEHRHSGIQGTYVRADDNALAPYVSIHSDAFALEDGRLRYLQQDFPDVRDGHQAWLLAKQKLFASRLGATASLTLDLKDLLIQVGDWVEWQSANPLRGTRTYRIVGSSLVLNMSRIKLQLREISASVFEDSSTAADVSEPPRDPGVFGYLTAAANVAGEAISLAGSDGSVLPALKFSYDGIADAAVGAVLFQYRVKAGPGAIVTDRDASPGDGAFITSRGVAPSQSYEFRHKLDTLPGRAVDWSAWADVTGSTSAPAVADGSVDGIKLAEAVNAMRVEASRQMAQLNEYLRTVDVAAAAQDQHQRSELTAKFDKFGALVVQEAKARADQYGSLAEAVTAVVAQYDDVTASGLFAMVAEAAPAGFEVKLTFGLRLEAGGDVYTAGISMLLDSAGNSLLDLNFDKTLVRGRMISQNAATEIDWDTGDVTSSGNIVITGNFSFGSSS